MWPQQWPHPALSLGGSGGKWLIPRKMQHCMKSLRWWISKFAKKICPNFFLMLKPTVVKMRYTTFVSQKILISTWDWSPWPCFSNKGSKLNKTARKIIHVHANKKCMHFYILYIETHVQQGNIKGSATLSVSVYYSQFDQIIFTINRYQHIQFTLLIFALCENSLIYSTVNTSI